MWQHLIADGVAAGNPDACAVAAAMLRELPEDVAVIAAALPVATALDVRNVGAHLVVSDGRHEVRITWSGQFRVWVNGTVIGVHPGLAAAITFADRHLRGRR